MKSLFTLIFTLIALLLSSQSQELSYYLPDIEYKKDIPTPEEFLGHQVGEWHVTHDKLYYYMKELADLSDRITLTEYARSHEHRPLIYLTITSADHHQNLEAIRIEHKKLTNPSISAAVNIDDLPIVIYQGNSIHGNEPSGANGALATAYYLAAGQGSEIDELLDNSIILLDPSFNPDGLQRFSTWVNTHKGDQLITDPNSREYNEMWPGGRTNHYWFDLNRDWLLLTHPESQGRIKTFHYWKPDILTDHHEMGSQSTFFFQPGIPSRTNPNTPSLNQSLTAKIGEFHAKALDEIGSLYYTKESYDDFYYGKGSTYPDIQGCIGILFEQASSRGHLQKTEHGLLSFPFTIRNQVKTMLSTQEAGIALRKEILEFKRKSFIEAVDLAKANKVKAYVFGENSDPYRVSRFVDILLQHQIEVFSLAKDFENFKNGQDYIVPLEPKQYRLVKSIFETSTEFQDSLFYDVSAWTLPFAFDIPYTEIKSTTSAYVGNKINTKPVNDIGVEGESQVYAYLIEWNQYLAPRLLNQLHEKEIIVKLANEPFSTSINGNIEKFGRGTLIIPVGNNQSIEPDELKDLMEELATYNSLKIYTSSSGQILSGVNLGSRSTSRLQASKPLVLIGQGVRSYDAGEIWHHFDQVLEMAVPMIDIARFSRLDLDDYNTIIMPDGRYNDLKVHIPKIKDWIKSGGNIIAFKGAINWLKSQDVISAKSQIDKSKKDDFDQQVYANASKQKGAKVTGGMIAKGDIDNTHPLFYGYNRTSTYFFKRGNSFYKPSGDVYNTPARYSSNPVASGYLHSDNVTKMKGSSAVFVNKLGAGKIISIVDNPLFRGYWWGGSKLFANALFFGDTID